MIDETNANASNSSSPLNNALGVVFNSPVRIFPARAKKKNPHIEGWQTKAADDFATIQAWWSKWPDALIALPTGEQNGLLGVDIDNRHKGHETLAALLDKHGPLPSTASYRTPGGQRYLFKWPAGVTIKSRNGDIGPGIDIRGGTAEGEFKGFVIIPPGTRADGGTYAWDDGCAGLHAAVDAPPWLLFLMLFSRREREALAAIGVTGPEGFKGLPSSAWQAEAGKRLKAAKPAPEPVDRTLSTGEIEGLNGYVRDAIKSECANLGNTTVNRQDHIGTSILSCQGLIKGLDAFGIETATMIEFAIEGLSAAFDALPDGEHKKESIEDRWERNWPTATPRDLTGKWAKRIGTDPAAEFQPIGDAPEAPATPASAPTDLVRWVDDQDLSAKIDWLIAGAIPRQSIGFIGAESGVGKTFAVIDLMLAIWRGKSWFGRAIDGAGGCYMVAAEGAYGIPLRVRAAAQHKFGAVAGIPFAYQSTPPGKLDEFVATLKAVDASMRERYGMPLRIVVLDTFAQCFGLKDENAATEVAKATRYMAAVANALGIAVCAVHHFGKDPNAGLRGSSALKAAADFVITLPAKGKLYLDKAKDAPDGMMLGRFALKGVMVGEQPTCIVDEGGVASEFEPVDDTTAAAVLAVCIKAAISEAGTERQHPRTGETVTAVTRAAVRKRFNAMWKGTEGGRREAFGSALKASEGVQVFVTGEDTWIALEEVSG